MDTEALLTKIRSAKNIPDGFEFCKIMYDALSRLNVEERSMALSWFFKTANDYYKCEKDGVPLPEEFSNYSRKYRTFIRSIVDFFSTKGYSEKSYYENLWNGIEELFSDATQNEKSYCLFEVLWHPRTPYYELPDSLQIPNSQYNEIIDNIHPFIRQLNFAFKLSENQASYTELTSRVVALLEKLSTIEEKSAFLVCFIRLLEISWKERKVKEESVPVPSKIKREPFGLNNSKQLDIFQLKETGDSDVNVVPTEIIARYQYPNVNNDEYDFLLLKREENIFLSDQGKTLRKLDEIFELSEPDVIKNIFAIINQYGVIKQGNEFLVKINGWDGNANKEENKEVMNGILSLFSCVSFMLNMKIFYR